MPNILSNLHKDLLIYSIESNNQKFQRRTINFCIKNKFHWLIPCEIMSSFLPSLDKNIQGISLFRKNNKALEMIITDIVG